MPLFRVGWAGCALLALVSRPSWAQPDTEPPSRQPVSVTADSLGFSLRSGDGDFIIRFRGYVQLDGRFYDDDETPATDEFLMRRVRPILEGTVDRIYDFRIMPDFGGSTTALFDAYLEARFSPGLALRAGKFRPPLGLEQMQSSADLRFVERGLTNNLVPTRDLGLQLNGRLWEGLARYEAGVYNGVPDLANGNTDRADGKDLVGRLLLTPFAPRGAAAPADLGFGIAASTGTEEGSPSSPALPAYRSPGQLTIFSYRSDAAAPETGTVHADGRRTRISPQAWINSGPLGVVVEYVRSRNEVSRGTGAATTTATLSHTAWQVAGSWFLTGETNALRAVAPRRPLDSSSRGWGAVELVGRYGEIDFDDEAFVDERFADGATSVTSARSLGVGVNWHLSRHVRIDTTYDGTTYTGGAVEGNRRNETFLVTRFQLSF